MEKELKVKVRSHEEDFYTQYQSLTCSDEPNVKYSVYNLCECPEDAIIDRDLFSADQYIATLNLGIKLAKKGYTKVVAEYLNEEDD